MVHRTRQIRRWGTVDIANRARSRWQCLSTIGQHGRPHCTNKDSKVVAIGFSLRERNLKYERPKIAKRAVHNTRKSIAIRITNGEKTGETKVIRSTSLELACRFLSIQKIQNAKSCLLQWSVACQCKCLSQDFDRLEHRLRMIPG
jgi:hypothetical protein